MELKVIKDKQYYHFYKQYVRKEPLLIGTFNAQSGVWDTVFDKEKAKGLCYIDNDYYRLFNPFLTTLARVLNEKIYNACNEEHKHFFAKNANHIGSYFCEDYDNYHSDKCYIAKTDKKRIKAFIKYINEIENTNRYLDIQVFLNDYSLHHLFNGQEKYLDELYGYYKMNKKATSREDFSDSSIKTSFNNTIMNLVNNCNANELTKEEIKTVEKIYFMQGAMMFANVNEVIDFVKYAKMLDLSTTGNFIMNYRTVMTAYVDNEEKIKDKLLNELQNLIPIGNFTYGNYSIIVPQTSSELRKYGDYFHNCLNGWEWHNRIKPKKYYVAIICKDEIPIICCDVERKSNKIDQYYYPNNSYVGRGDDWDFHDVYQKYLNTLEIK